ncbi:MAG: NAD-dependent epimerase/dehydratase family protein [Flavobacteriales bacterium]|nr:NAD-dependent epimerase/dehydratase family protein [Flavobacteriales bacterium]
MKKVLLTGISGYIGLHCAVELLKKGYTVRGSVRNLKKADSIRASLAAHVDIEDKLEFCELNLLANDGWNEAAVGCDFLMHVASPYFSKVPKDEQDLIRPAVRGTSRALRAAHKAGIRRVVLTSSIAAMLGELEGMPNMDESTWTNTESMSATPYIKSKTIAEKGAWDFANKHDIELVTIHPGPVYGPPIDENLNGESMSFFVRILKGEIPGMFKGCINLSDVRDVAKIHVKALENKEAKGHRFIVASNRGVEYSAVPEILKSHGYEVSDKIIPTFLIKLIGLFNSEMKGVKTFAGKEFTGDTAMTKTIFNWEPIPLERTVLDTAEKIEELIKESGR